MCMRMVWTELYLKVMSANTGDDETARVWKV